MVGITPTLPELAAWLHAEFGEAQPLKREGRSAVERLALALEPDDLPPALDADALFLHRSRRLGEGWPGLGVLGVHDGFDLALTTGPNRRLARVLGWRDVREVVWRGKLKGLVAAPPRPAGMRCVPPCTLNWAERTARGRPIPARSRCAWP